MPDPIIITADDKRIRDLLQQDALALNDFIAVDRPGWLTARRFTIQNVINLLSLNLPVQEVLSGTTNPDNASGKSGDIYFKTGNSRLAVYQKSGSTWQDIFDIAIGATKEVLSGDQSSVTSENEQGRINVPDITDETIWKASYKVGADTFQIEQSMLQNNVLYGFPDPSNTNFTYSIIYI